MPDEALARLLGLDKQILTKTLATILDYGVASRDIDGALICRRMIRDETLRQIRTESGKKGGNPNLVNQNSTKPKKEVNQNSTPSVSSSSSSSTSITEEKEETIVSSKKRKSQIPEDFAINEKMRDWALENVPLLNIDLETRNFVDHYRNKGETGLDWTAKWRTWQRNAFTEFGKYPEGKPSLKKEQDAINQNTNGKYPTKQSNADIYASYGYFDN